MKKYLTGFRPTGNLHLGNYLGAIKQAKELNATVFIADLHSNASKEIVLQTKKCLESCGIKDIRLESDSAADILQIYHRLSDMITVNDLKRMTQYKVKSQNEAATLKLLSYPVLMAADIFYYSGTHIPIGADQVQHIECARRLARRSGYTPPEPLISDYPRIMSLSNGLIKMSKSDINDNNRINLSDDADLIIYKINKARTSSDISESTPEMQNLMMIYKACGGIQNHTSLKDFKKELAELIIKELQK